ncbi:MAG: SLC13 family permease [Acidobacteriota bacterium]|nr:SLC13 family permease [Acidobacteriota bacterium]
MTFEMLLLAAIVAASVILFAFEVFPVDKVSLLILSALVAFRLVSPEEAIAGFGNPATVTVACMLALSYGLESTGALSYVANKLVDLARESEFRLLFAIIAAVGLLSAFINNTAAVALFLPLTMAVAREKNMDPGKFLMPMSFAAIVAGTCTLIGTSTNLLVYSLAKEHLDWQIGMFEFTPVGLIFFLIGSLYLLFVGYHLVPSRKSGGLIREYRLRHFVTEMILSDNSPLIGKSIAETTFREKYGLEVVEILRGTSRLLPSAQQTRLEAGDTLLVQGDPQSLLQVQNSQGVTIKALTVKDQDLEDENIVLVEAFISPTSRLVDSTLKEVNFRQTFNANALAIRSHGRTIRERIGKIRLEYGDSLLILTSRDQLETLRHSPDFLVFEEVRHKSVRQDKIYYGVGIFLAIILLVTFNLLTIVEAAVMGTGLMLLTGCLRLHDLYSHISWQTIVMLACLIPLGSAMENTGLATFFATELTANLHLWGPWAVLSGIYLFTSLLTSFMSNNATAVLMIPIVLSTAQQLQLNPKPLVMAVMFAASASFMTPIGYQTNLFIFGPGGYRFSDFLKVGAPLNFILWIVASITIPMIWPL